ncbi:hypothetical protein JNJ66_00275 [Candidatus Saccharibacteria bacterium]|nr:hypothetical protein [Candidatus Saccharibacteria bacterium]
MKKTHTVLNGASSRKKFILTLLAVLAAMILLYNVYLHIIRTLDLNELKAMRSAVTEISDKVHQNNKNIAFTHENDCPTGGLTFRPRPEPSSCWIIAQAQYKVDSTEQVKRLIDETNKLVEQSEHVVRVSVAEDKKYPNLKKPLDELIKSEGFLDYEKRASMSFEIKKPNAADCGIGYFIGEADSDEARALLQIGVSCTIGTLDNYAPSEW